MATAGKPWCRPRTRPSTSPSGRVVTGWCGATPHPPRRSWQASHLRETTQSHSLSFETMASIAQRPRGTQDLFPAAQPYWEALEVAAKDIAGRFGYQRIETPSFESTALFVRGVGEGTDIVSKEMFTFSDRGGRSLTLRPG